MKPSRLSWFPRRARAAALRPRLALPGWGLGLSLLLGIGAGESVGIAGGHSPAVALYNDGTRQLAAGHWREAEALLQRALALDDERVLGRALVNLGQVRFRSGAQALEEAPTEGRLRPPADVAHGRVAEAVAFADRALAGRAATPLVVARNRLRTVRRELRKAAEPVQRAEAGLAVVEERWRRAAADFRGAVELEPAHPRAAGNADAVERHLAALDGRRRPIGDLREQLDRDRREVEARLQALRQRLPPDDPQDPRGSDDEDEPDDAAPRAPEPSPSPELGGREQQLSLTREEALRLLGSLRVESDRQLPVGERPRDDAETRGARDW